jgi:hypothetical protein
MKVFSPKEQAAMRERAKAFFDFLVHSESENPVNNPINPAELVRETLAWAMCCIPLSHDYSDDVGTGRFALDNMCQVLNTIPVEDFFGESGGDRKVAVRKAIELMARFVFQADWTPILEQARESATEVVRTEQIPMTGEYQSCLVKKK